MFHGLVLVDKPTGITSHDLVARARRVFKTKAVGHCGTLDPLATGLMVLLINEATKLSQYILDGDKAYRAEARFGVETDTLDITGQVTRESAITSSEGELNELAAKLSGIFEWPVPVYSAIKVEGQKLYDRARRGEDFEPPKKMMNFWNIKALSGKLPTMSWEIHCSKGSYIRTWIQQLGVSSNSLATMSALHRIYSAPFSVDQAMSLEAIEQALPSLDQDFSRLPCVVPIESALTNLKRIRIKGADEKLLRNGAISHDLRALLIQTFNPEIDQFVQIQTIHDGKLLALIGLNPGQGFAIKRVFQY